MDELISTDCLYTSTKAVNWLLEKDIIVVGTR